VIKRIERKGNEENDWMTENYTRKK